jgi:hypothetical protein
MALLATALACLSMHAGCGAPAPKAPPPVSRFALSYERSGGLKPVPRRLTIRPGRIGTVMVHRGGVGESEGAATIFKVPAKTIRGLRRALRRVGFAALADPGSGPGTCADCYSYEIRYRDHDVTFDDATMPNSLGPIVNRLEMIVEAHLPFH